METGSFSFSVSFPIFHHGFSPSFFGRVGAVRGETAAHAASAQMLTQAIRPPIPSPDDIQRNIFKMEGFEASAR